MSKWIKAKQRAIESSNGPNTPEKTTTAPFIIEGMDIKNALRRVAGNEKLLRKLLRLFVEKQSDAASRIKMAIMSNDAETATREAHTIKGLAGNIGADILFKYAEELEQMLKIGDTSTLDQTLSILAGELFDVIEKISASLRTVIETKSSAV